MTLVFTFKDLEHLPEEANSDNKMLQPQHHTISDMAVLRTSSKDEEEILLEPYSYIQRIPGKEIRTKLSNAFNYWLKIPQDKLNAIIDIVNILHISSLLIDDIQDNSVLRRGIPAAHNICGIPSTINSAIYAISIAFKRVTELKHPEGAQICTEQLMQLYRGQGMEIYCRDNYICPSETAYKKAAMAKAEGSFSLIVRLMQLFSDYKKNVTTLIGILAVYYQIRDDYYDLCLDEYAENKGCYCEDLTEGKFNLPIIHAIQTNSRGKQIMNILRQRTKDIAVKRYCVSLLKESGSLAYTRTVLEELDKQAREEIDRLGGNPLLFKILDDLLNWKSQNK